MVGSETVTAVLVIVRSASWAATSVVATASLFAGVPSGVSDATCAASVMTVPSGTSGCTVVVTTKVAPAPGASAPARAQELSPAPELHGQGPVMSPRSVSGGIELLNDGLTASDGPWLVTVIV